MKVPHMAHRREVSIGVCGAVIGMMLGVGSALVLQDSLLVGSVAEEGTVTYRNAIFDRAFQKRSISDSDKKESS